MKHLDTNNEEKIDKYREEIEEEEQEIEHLENKISSEEDQILKVKGKGYPKARALFRTGFLRRFARHKLLYSLTVVAAVVLVWRGMWGLADMTPGLSNPIVSIVLGVFIIWLVDSISKLL